MTQRLAPEPSHVARFDRELAALWPRAAGERLLVAVSGGPDSMALLLLAHAALGDAVVAATVDHGLRADAAREAAFVADHCRRLGVAHTILSGELPARTRGTANLSARARVLRYRLLEGHMAETGAARLATAHHADDQLETLIMRLNRGAGTAGLAGVRARGGRIVRPLLGWRRMDLAALVAACGIAAVADPSNVDDRFDRARLRKALGDAGWLDAAMWQRSAAALGDAEEALEWAARRFVDERAGARGEGIFVLLFGDTPPPWEIARRTFLIALREVNPGADPTGAELVRLATSMLAGEAAMTLAGVRVATRRDGTGKRAFEFRRVPPPRAH